MSGLQSLGVVGPILNPLHITYPFPVFTGVTANKYWLQTRGNVRHRHCSNEQAGIEEHWQTVSPLGRYRKGPGDHATTIPVGLVLGIY